MSVGEAMRTIRHGYADTMIAGGSEAELAAAAQQVLAKQKAAQAAAAGA